jgi:hypothetical protein
MCNKVVKKHSCSQLYLRFYVKYDVKNKYVTISALNTLLLDP